MLARSNVVLEGYWEQPEETAKALGGRLVPHRRRRVRSTTTATSTIQDRKKDVIITGGENVSSIEVEDAIFSHPDVAEVAVIGVPDEKWGETIKALVVKAEGSDADRAGADRLREGQGRPLQGAVVGRVPRRRSPAPRPASCRSSSCARRTGRAATARSTDVRDVLAHLAGDRADPGGPVRSTRSAPGWCAAPVPRPGGLRLHPRDRPAPGRPRSPGSRPCCTRAASPSRPSKYAGVGVPAVDGLEHLARDRHARRRRRTHGELGWRVIRDRRSRSTCSTPSCTIFFFAFLPQFVPAGSAPRACRTCSA